VAGPPGPERWAAPGDENLVRRWDSAYGRVDVVRGRNGVLKVRQNMHYRFGTTGADAPRAERQAHLPLLLHPRPAEVLFLGLGTGVTAAGALPHPEVERVTVVELVPEVLEAARLLAPANRGVVDHARVEVRADDARHFLLAADRRFDVIVSDLFVPWESETGYLYTVEHYRAARGRLNAGGLFCQWLPVYQLGPRELELIADSFAAVFPDSSLWWGHLDARRPIVALVGGDGPVVADAGAVEGRLRRLWEAVPVDDEIRTARYVFDRYLGHWLPRRPDRLNTDEHPRVEFSTPVSHRSHALLSGDALRRYYDDVLARLPDRAERVAVPPNNPTARRAGHRLVLFPR
jgi:spermidine synthase